MQHASVEPANGRARTGPAAAAAAALPPAGAIGRLPHCRACAQIAVEGCGHGELDKIYETMQYLERKEGKKIDLLICCGDFQVRACMRASRAPLWRQCGEGCGAARAWACSCEAVHTTHAHTHAGLARLSAGCAQHGRPGVHGLPGQVPPHRHVLQVLLRARADPLPDALQ